MLLPLAGFHLDTFLHEHHHACYSGIQLPIKHFRLKVIEELLNGEKTF